MDISNKTLSIFLVVAIVISMGSALESIYGIKGMNGLTGHAVSAGNTTLNVQTTSSIIFVYNLLDLGTGYVNTSYNNCTLLVNTSNSITATGCVGFNTTVDMPDTFIIMNNGNTYLNVTMNSSANATNFIGGTTTIMAFQYVVTNNESASCLGNMPYNGTWFSPSINDSPTVCGNLSYLPGAHTLRMGLRVVIPSNAVQGSKTATFVVTGS